MKSAYSRLQHAALLSRPKPPQCRASNPCPWSTYTLGIQYKLYFLRSLLQPRSLERSLLCLNSLDLMVWPTHIIAIWFCWEWKSMCHRHQLPRNPLISSTSSLHAAAQKAGILLSFLLPQGQLFPQQSEKATWNRNPVTPSWSPTASDSWTRHANPQQSSLSAYFSILISCCSSSRRLSLANWPLSSVPPTSQLVTNSQPFYFLHVLPRTSQRWLLLILFSAQMSSSQRQLSWRVY